MQDLKDRIVLVRRMDQKTGRPLKKPYKTAVLRELIRVKIDGETHE